MTAQERNKNEALPNLELPKSRVVGRIADMNPKAHLRVCLDEDDDLFLGVWDARGMAVISFITPGPGGGKSPRTRSALIALRMLCTNAFELCFPSPRSQSQGAGGGFRAMTPAQTRIHAVDKGRRAPFRRPHARCTRTLPIASSLCLAIHRLPSANSVTICSVFFFRPR